MALPWLTCTGAAFGNPIMARELLGQRVTRALKAVGVQPAVQAISKRLGVDCGCAKRSVRLDRWDAKRRR